MAPTSVDATPRMMSIAVIGAGSAGMVVAKQVREVSARLGLANNKVKVTIFERRKEVGGIWQYDEPLDPGFLAGESKEGKLVPVTGNTQDSPSQGRLRYGTPGVQKLGPMFQGLRTNIASDLMTYRDSPFPPSKDNLFPSRETVQDYLVGYAKKHNISACTRFQTTVTSLKKDARGEGWLLKSREEEEKGGEEIEEQFTHVAVCHGRCNTPNIPTIEGLETFTGRIMHSAWYRDPSEMKERTFLVVGNASSGMDISRELAGFTARTLPSSSPSSSSGLTPKEWKEECKRRQIKVYSSWHSLDKAPPMDFNPLDSDSPEWCRNIQVVDQIKKVQGNLIYLESGTILDDVEVIIFATGYLFDNPYIDQTGEPLRSEPLLPPSESPSRIGFPAKGVDNLDDWFLFHRSDESIAFFGLPITVVPFPFTEAQAIFTIHRWLGLAPSLPLLDSNIPPTEAARWTSRRGTDDTEEKRASAAAAADSTQNGETIKSDSSTTPSMVIGHPSDVSYVDSLMQFLRQSHTEAGQRPPWEQDYQSDGMGNGTTPRGPEGLYAMTQWRIERRANGKKLRREVLGY